jgi:hypothetical protein
MICSAVLGQCTSNVTVPPLYSTYIAQIKNRHGVSRDTHTHTHMQSCQSIMSETSVTISPFMTQLSICFPSTHCTKSRTHSITWRHNSLHPQSVSLLVSQDLCPSDPLPCRARLQKPAALSFLPELELQTRVCKVAHGPPSLGTYCIICAILCILHWSNTDFWEAKTRICSISRWQLGGESWLALGD